MPISQTVEIFKKAVTFWKLAGHTDKIQGKAGVEVEDFEKIYADYYQAVYRYALSLCRDREWAEEITQESFFKALKSIDSFR